MVRILGPWYGGKNLLSKSLKLVNLILFLIPRTYAALLKQFASIHIYPEFKADNAMAVSLAL